MPAEHYRHRFKAVLFELQFVHFDLHHTSHVCVTDSSTCEEGN